MERSTRFFVTGIWLLVAVALGVTAKLYLFDKTYYFTVEASCDPASENCFNRDCSVDGDCPPNNLADYKVFKVHAKDFYKCADNSCAPECMSGAISCVEVKCGDSADDSCAVNPEQSSQ